MKKMKVITFSGYLILGIASLGFGCQPQEGGRVKAEFSTQLSNVGSFDSNLQSLAKDFFQWRAVTQPITGDDVPRIERMDGWTPNFSSDALNAIQEKYDAFKEGLNRIPRENWTRTDSVDYLLLRSAIERVNWELNVLCLPRRNPNFYVHQTVGAFYDLLIVSSPITDSRVRNMIARLKSIPATLAHAQENLTEPVALFADIALLNLKNIRDKMGKTVRALDKYVSNNLYAELESANEHAVVSLEDYAEWIRANRFSMSNSFGVGRKGYEYFLNRIALIPYTPEILLMQGQSELNRAIACEAIEKERNMQKPELEIFHSIEEMLRQSHKDEESIRKFLKEKNIVTVPVWLQHYTLKEIPDHVKPLSFIGQVYDLTSESRLDENSVRYVPKPTKNLPYFYLSMAKDPRPVIIHEGVPGHYFQLAMSWCHPDPVRRRYIDSGPNEGIGFYVEELMLKCGLFDNRPRVREIIFSFMRLRALRVEVDVQLALGNFTVEGAGHYLEKTVPMDYETAIEEAKFFASTPGQAITYQIGKLQILKFLADAKIMMGENFCLRDFHDYLMQNGNVPIALQRWEYLGLRDEIDDLW